MQYTNTVKSCIILSDPIGLIQNTLRFLTEQLKKERDLLKSYTKKKKEFSDKEINSKKYIDLLNKRIERELEELNKYR